MEYFCQQNDTIDIHVIQMRDNDLMQNIRHNREVKNQKPPNAVTFGGNAYSAGVVGSVVGVVGSVVGVVGSVG